MDVCQRDEYLNHEFSERTRIIPAMKSSGEAAPHSCLRTGVQKESYGFRSSSAETPILVDVKFYFASKLADFPFPCLFLK
jgi:hypothetical protein